MTAPAGQLAIKDIAALAKVTRAAVSNWRARYDDFPAPTPDSPTRRPLFNLQDILAWLEARDLLPDDAGKKKTELNLKATINLLRATPLEPSDATLLTLYLLALRKQSGTQQQESPWQAIASAKTTDELTQALSTAPAPAGISSTADLGITQKISALLPDRMVPDLVTGLDTTPIANYEDAAGLVIDTFLGLGGRGEDSMFGTSTSASSTLLVNAAATTLSAGDTLFDPACGIGGTLLALHKKVTDLTVVGTDILTFSVTIAQLHAYLAELPATFTQADSLTEDPHQGLQAHTIVSEPPIGMRIDRQIQQELLTNTGLKSPGAPMSEEAFLLYTLSHLAPGGRGYILTGMGAGFRAPSAQLRQQLVAHGFLEAVVQLPSKLLAYSGIPTLLWVLRAPETSPETSVLIADASDASSPETHIAQWLTDLRAGRETSIPTGRITLAELITNEGALIPAQLLREDRSSQEVHEDLQHSITALQQTLELIQRAASKDHQLFDQVPTSTTSTTLKQLIEMKTITRYRGTHQRRKTAPPETGVEAHLIPLRNQSNGVEKVTVDEDTPWIQNGDVLVPDHARLPARVFTADGSRWVAPMGMVVLRVNDQSLDPHYLTACINASFNEAATLGATIQRRDFTHIQIPQLEITSQKKIVGSLAELAELKVNAERLARLIDDTADAAINVVRYGADTN